jgi:hypothetical protein
MKTMGAATDRLWGGIWQVGGSGMSEGGLGKMGGVWGETMRAPLQAHLCFTAVPGHCVSQVYPPHLCSLHCDCGHVQRNSHFWKACKPDNIATEN